MKIDQKSPDYNLQIINAFQKIFHFFEKNIDFFDRFFFLKRHTIINRTKRSFFQTSKTKQHGSGGVQ